MQTSLNLMVLQAQPLARFVRNDNIPSALWDFSSGFYTGGWSLARGGPAHWFDATGQLNTAPVDEARFVQTPSGRALLVETASTNLIDASNLTNINLTTVETGVTAGGMDFTRLSSIEPTGYLQFNGVDISGLSVGQPVSFSLVVRADSDSFDLWLGVGTTGAGRVRCSVVPASLTATILQDIDETGATVEIVPLGGGNLRVSVSGAMISTDGAELLRIASLSGTMQFARPQVEGQGTASSVIPGTTQGSARAPDLLSLSHTDGTYTAVVRRAGGAEEEIPATVSGGTWSPSSLSGDILSIALYA